MAMEIPYFKQETLYTCGAATSRMILCYYEIDKSEAQLVEILDITPENGTTLSKIKEFFENLGFNCDYFQRVESTEKAFKKLENYLKEDIPVIISVNRFDYDTVTERLDIETMWEERDFSYHFIIPTGIDVSDVYFNDPHERIGRYKLSRKNFLRAWYNDRLRGEILAVRSKYR